MLVIDLKLLKYDIGISKIKVAQNESLDANISIDKLEASNKSSLQLHQRKT
jgi:hypothetical protein